MRSKKCVSRERWPPNRALPEKEEASGSRLASDRAERDSTNAYIQSVSCMQ